MTLCGAGEGHVQYLTLAYFSSNGVFIISGQVRVNLTRRLYHCLFVVLRELNVSRLIAKTEGTKRLAKLREVKDYQVCLFSAELKRRGPKKGLCHAKNDNDHFGLFSTD